MSGSDEKTGQVGEESAESSTSSSPSSLPGSSRQQGIVEPLLKRTNVPINMCGWRTHYGRRRRLIQIGSWGRMGNSAYFQPIRGKARYAYGNSAYFQPIRGKAKYAGCQTNSYFEIVEIATFSELGCNITVYSERCFNFLIQKLLPHRETRSMKLEEQRYQEMTNCRNWVVILHPARPTSLEEWLTSARTVISVPRGTHYVPDDGGRRRLIQHSPYQSAVEQRDKIKQQGKLATNLLVTLK